MLRKATNGERIWKRVIVRVVLPDKKGFTWRPMAGPRKGYTAENVQQVLEKCSESLEKKYPNFEFELIELEPNRFNMVYVGELAHTSGGMPLTCGETETTPIQNENALSPQA